MANIAFIGLGNMGGPMAHNLLKAGHQVRGFDLMAPALEALEVQGGVAMSSAQLAVNDTQSEWQADFVVSMLPAGKHVMDLYLGENGLINHVAPSALVIDSSTIDAATARTVGEAFEQRGLAFIDAPVSGGVGGATAGTLTFIVGGAEEHFQRAKDVLEVMGKNIFHAGGPGAGQVAKICNNMLLSVLMIGTSEALQMGIDNGLDPKVMSDIMLQSSGRNWTLELYNPCAGVMPNVPSSNDYQGGFMVDLMKKDLGLAMDTGIKSQSSTPMGALAQSLYSIHSLQGSGKRDFSSIFEMFSQK